MSAKFAGSEWQAYCEASPGVGGESLTGTEYMTSLMPNGDTITFTHAAIVEAGAVVACSTGFYGAGWEEYIGDFEAQLVKIANFTATNAPKVEDGDYSSMGSPQFLAWINETTKKENEELEGEAKYMTIKVGMETIKDSGENDVTVPYGFFTRNEKDESGNDVVRCLSVLQAPTGVLLLVQHVKDVTNNGSACTALAKYCYYAQI